MAGLGVNPQSLQGSEEPELEELDDELELDDDELSDEDELLRDEVCLPDDFSSELSSELLSESLSELLLKLVLTGAGFVVTRPGVQVL